jgi:hypothetical protein
MVFVNMEVCESGEWFWTCEDMTTDLRTVLSACECGFESGCRSYDFIYMGF